VDDPAIASTIARHYASVRRDLPWRRTRDPYAIWVSEIMLQQTRAQTVIPYWERWMQAIPTVGALARAPLDDVLAAWAGLGYYSRARNLHAGAQTVAAKWSGALPTRASDLREVPGIGPYTAGAIASIAFGERAPLVDGNVARVLARVYGIEDDIKSTNGQRSLWQHAATLMKALPEAAVPGDLNQGLMELGATICSPTRPRCLVCPLAAHCTAARAGRQDELPVVAPRKKQSDLPVIARAALWIEAEGELVLARRKPVGLFGGLWELPQAERASDVGRALGTTRIERSPVAFHDQTLTHRRLRIAVFRAEMPPQLVEAADPSYDAIARVPLSEIRQLGVAAATIAILSKYEDTPWSSTQRHSPSSRRATTRSSKVSRTSVTTRPTRTSPTPRSGRRKGSTSSSTTRSK
jgi:A/G-specific adenine glycosylase